MGDKNRLILFFTILIFFSIQELKATHLPFFSDVKWKVVQLYVSTAKEPVLTSALEEADTVGFVYYKDKILVVEEDWMKYGWKKIVYPISGFINEKHLITREEKIDLDRRYNVTETENEYSRWTWEVVSCPRDYVLVRSQMNEASDVAGLLSTDDEMIIVRDQIDFQGIWIKVAYPYKGYIKYSDAFEGTGYPYLAFGVTYGAKHIPYEKNLKNYFNPIGGYFEFSNTSWDLGFRLGYNYSESRLSTFYVKTHQAYLHIIYKVFRLFNRTLEFYALAGGNYWFSSFENKKYGPENTYFRLEKDRGPGYVFGGGMIFNLGKFYIEAQYNLFGSEQAEFGTKPVQGVFRNYSTLYPGSNHFSVILGYRFVL